MDIDLPSELAAARKRLAERTATALRDSRVNAIRSAVRPGSPRLEVEEVAHRFYPRLRPELVEEAINIVCGGPAPAAEPAAEAQGEAPVSDLEVLDELHEIDDLDELAPEKTPE